MIQISAIFQDTHAYPKPIVAMAICKISRSVNISDMANYLPKKRFTKLTVTAIRSPPIRNGVKLKVSASALTHPKTSFSDIILFLIEKTRRLY
jgi:hypothetical protein